jgi:hypothetical protein
VHSILTLFLCSVVTVGLSQTAGRENFAFLHVPAHARLAALGGVNVSLADKDINFFHNNPALAGDTLSGFASAGYQFYAGDVGNALFSYGHDFEKLGQILVGLQHTDYGTLQGYDESGMETLAFSSAETAILVGRSHQLESIRLAATVKAVFSTLAGYRASALLMDIGGIFQHPHQDLTVGLAIKNIGVVLSHYSSTGSGTLPFDVQAGVTIKPEYMPVRFSLTAYQLAKTGLLYDGNAYGDDKPSTLQKVFSHLNMGVEILFHKNVNVLVGYNYLLHRALLMETGSAGAGVSFGFSLFVKPVEFVFSRNAYTVGNAGYSFTLSTNVNQLLKTRKY